MKGDKRLNFKNYNLIILTDGELDYVDEDEDEISDVEDAEPYRLVRKKIVETAQILEVRRARRDILGIQFCQIGGNPDAEQFFQYPDDEIKKNHKLKRDVS